MIKTQEQCCHCLHSTKHCRAALSCEFNRKMYYSVSYELLQLFKEILLIKYGISTRQFFFSIHCLPGNQVLVAFAL